MVDPQTSFFHSRFIQPPVVHPSILPPSAVTVLTHLPGSIISTIRKSPEALADIIRREARACNAKYVRLTDPLEPDQFLALGTEMARVSHSLRLSITAQLAVEDDHLLVPPSDKSGIKQVEWVQVHGALGSLTKSLKAFSKSGIWNHVVLTDPAARDFGEAIARFVVTNPNIVHSWQLSASADSSGDDALNAMDAFYSTYSTYKRLPGRPFWTTLSDGNDLLLYLSQYGLLKLSRWWLQPDGQAMATMGENLNYHFVKPRALSTDRLDEICQLVAAGGSVDTQWVKFNLKRAFLIAYVTEMDRVVADSSLKHPRAEYIAALNEQAGMDLSNYLERGYTSVRPEYRGLGIGTRLLEGLTARSKGRKIFSLISEDNVATQKIALRNRTRKITTFFSHRAGKEMGVWMPEAMLE